MATEALLPERAAREKIQCSIAVAAATSAGERRRVEEEEEGTTEEEAQESAWREEEEQEEEEEVVVEMSVGSSGGGGWRQYRVVRWGRNKVYEPLLIILRRYLLSFQHCIQGGCLQKRQADSSSVIFLFLFLSSSTVIPLKLSSLFRFFPPEGRGVEIGSSFVIPFVDSGRFSFLVAKA
jgi:hypothetical protein